MTDAERAALEVERANQGLPPRAADVARLARVLVRCEPAK